MLRESPAGRILCAGVAWILLGVGVAFFQPAILDTETRIMVELACVIGGSLHLAIADAIKYLEGRPHGR